MTTEPTAYSNETFVSLLAKLDRVALTAAERTLLRAILTVAQEITEVIVPDASGATAVTGPEVETDFTAEFAAAFTASKAELIGEYAHAPRPGMVGRVTTAAAWASPAMVGRMVGR